MPVAPAPLSDRLERAERLLRALRVGVRRAYFVEAFADEEIVGFVDGTGCARLAAVEWADGHPRLAALADGWPV